MQRVKVASVKKFTTLLRQHNHGEIGRRWLYVPYDQLSDKIGPLFREAPEKLGIILIENPWKAARRPYHKQKLGLILANLRHFALEQAKRGVAVRHIVADGPYHLALEPLTRELGEIRMMEAAERELRVDLENLTAGGAIKVIPHEGWLTTRADLEAARSKDGSYRMDSFYRAVRQRTGILMEGGKPLGGKYSFDSENRQAWNGQPSAPAVPTFEIDEVTQEVGNLINRHFAHHPGSLDLTQIPSTEDHAQILWRWAKENCLAHFGPFEDAMSTRSNSLFHTRISAALNINRLIPAQVVQDALEMDIPLACKEGFIRQIVGWREFVHKIHVVTDGFRQQAQAIAEEPGEANYKAWAKESWRQKQDHNRQKVSAEPDGGAIRSFLQAENDLPPAYWGQESGLNCLDTVIKTVWEEGYSHHITRLMVLSNIANLLDISPRQLTDWFWLAYTDAYDWVVEPNVMAMGTYGVGGLMTTKPYISGAAYINKMSDYCKNCRFDPSKNCPITRLYWAFLERHNDKLSGNQRLAMPLNSIKKRGQKDKTIDKKVFEKTLQIMTDGAILPADIVNKTAD